MELVTPGASRASSRSTVAVLQEFLACFRVLSATFVNCEPSPIQWQDLLSNIIQDSSKNKLHISRQTGIPLALTLGYAYMDFLEFWTYQ